MTIKKSFKISAVIFLLVWWNSATAQTESRGVNVYAQVGAFPGAEATLNLEKRIYAGDKIACYGRIGGGFAGVVFGPGGMAGCGAISMLTGKKNNHFELDGGVMIGQDADYQDLFIFPILDVAYRYQKPEGGLLLKAKAGVLGVFGFAVGYAF